MGLELSQSDFEKLVSKIVERVVRRVAEEEVRSSDSSSTVVPCAIPPPGSPRYESVVANLDARALKNRKDGS